MKLVIESAISKDIVVFLYQFLKKWTLYYHLNMQTTFPP